MDTMWYNKAGCRLRGGQAMLEYVLALAGLLVVVAVMWTLVSASEKQTHRTVNLVSSEYP